MSPFHVVYGREPPSILGYIPKSTKTEAVDKFLLDRQDLLHQLKQNLATTQARMKQATDNNRRDEVFTLVIMFWLSYSHIDRPQ